MGPRVAQGIQGLFRGVPSSEPRLRDKATTLREAEHFFREASGQVGFRV